MIASTVVTTSAMSFTRVLAGPPRCSDRTIRRLKDWAEAGTGERLHALALRAYDQVIGLELGDIPVDGCMTSMPSTLP